MTSFQGDSPKGYIIFVLEVTEFSIVNLTEF